MKVQVTMRPRDADFEPFTVYGHVPYDGCPIAVTRPVEWDFEFGIGREVTDNGWRLTHRALGLRLSSTRYRTRKEALDMLERCGPKRECWQKATGAKDDPATIEAFGLLKAAMGLT